MKKRVIKKQRKQEEKQEEKQNSAQNDDVVKCNQHPIDRNTKKETKLLVVMFRLWCSTNLSADTGTNYILPPYYHHI